MVFSFFKKQAEKMPERPAAKPKPAVEALPENAASIPPVLPAEESRPPVEALPDLEFTASSIAAAQTKPPAAAVAASAPPADAFDDEFSTWSDVGGINVDHDVDPLEACVEQATVMFANGQDAAARSLLETFVKAYPGLEGKRFWLMLFDLLQVLGDRAGFDKLGVEYVHACETSPPAWRGYAASGAAPLPAGRGNGARKIYLQGVLTGDGGQALGELIALIEQKAPVVVDCGKLAGCDDEIAGEWADWLVRARKARVAVALVGIENFLKRLNDRLVVGEAVREPSWRLLLELLQRHGTQEIFEERAVDYAVTFERSPPSWEAQPVEAVVAVAKARSDDAHYLRGELKNHRFEELVGVLEGSAQPILDFSDVPRMDFVSAGQLVNRLVPYKAQGKEITIRGPNRLVAELMAVVGLNKQARIIVPKS